MFSTQPFSPHHVSCSSVPGARTVGVGLVMLGTCCRGWMVLSAVDMLQLLHQRVQPPLQSAASQGREQEGGWFNRSGGQFKTMGNFLDHQRMWSPNGTAKPPFPIPRTTEPRPRTNRAFTYIPGRGAAGASTQTKRTRSSRKRSEKETFGTWPEPPSKRSRQCRSTGDTSRMCGKNASWDTFLDVPAKYGRCEKAEKHPGGHGTKSTTCDAGVAGQHGGGKPEKKDGKALLKSVTEQIGSGDDLEKPTTTVGAGSMKRALEVASSPTLREEGIKELKKNFWATSTLHVRKSRREEVLKLAVEVNQHQGPIFPLKEDVIIGVAAALKAAGMKSGDQYLNELKLWHVEQGFEQPAWMVRCIGLCKKALMRGRGPEKRAAELNPLDISEERWTWRPRDQTLYVRPALAFTWACVWMLREIELGNMRWKHVTTMENSRTVKIVLPISKTDQTGIGIRRTLTCCGEKPCHRMCPWSVWTEIEKLRPAKDLPEDMIFRDQKGKTLSKSKTVAGWKGLSNTLVSGHSARRSGAMAYVRAGLPIQELAFLGRWKSSVVLRYAEDALQEVPANLKCNMELQARVPMPSATKKTTRKEKTLVTDEPENISLWVASNNYKKNKSWHPVKIASWQLPLEDWSTCCGWYFARHSANVSFLTNLGFNHSKCSKCKEWQSTRDSVKEDGSLACATAKGLIQILKWANERCRWSRFAEGQWPATSNQWIKVLDFLVGGRVCMHDDRNEAVWEMHSIDKQYGVNVVIAWRVVGRAL